VPHNATLATWLCSPKSHNLLHINRERKDTVAYGRKVSRLLTDIVLPTLWCPGIARFCHAWLVC